MDIERIRKIFEDYRRKGRFANTQFYSKEERIVYAELCRLVADVIEKCR